MIRIDGKKAKPAMTGLEQAVAESFEHSSEFDSGFSHIREGRFDLVEFAPPPTRIPESESSVAENRNALIDEFPAWKPNIEAAEKDGFTVDEIRSELVKRELIERFENGRSQDEIDAEYGRDPETKAKTLRRERKNRTHAYYGILRDTHTKKQIDEILHVSEITGFSPSVLMTNPELFARAQEDAGRVGSVVDYLGNFVRSVWSGAYQGRLAKSGAEAAWSREAAEQAAPEPQTVAQGRGNVSRAETPEEAQRRYKAATERARRDYAKYRNDAMWFARVESERDRIRPPDSFLGAFLLSVAESAGFSITSGAKAGVSRAVGALLGGFAGGPAGGKLGADAAGVIASLFNTDTEAKMEAGGILLDKQQRYMAQGMSFDDAFEKAFSEVGEAMRETYRNNALWLVGANALGDYLTMGAGSFAARAGKTAGRTALRRMIPYLAGAAVEGAEEAGQEIIRMMALDESIDAGAVTEAFGVGMGHSLFYTGVGRGAMRMAERFGGKKNDAVSSAANQIADVAGAVNGGEMTHEEAFGKVRELSKKLAEAERNALDEDTPEAAAARSRRDEVKSSLLANSGMTEEQAQANADIYASYLLAGSKRFGLSVDELHRLRIQGEEETGSLDGSFSQPINPDVDLEQEIPVFDATEVLPQAIAADKTALLEHLRSLAGQGIQTLNEEAVINVLRRVRGDKTKADKMRHVVYSPIPVEPEQANVRNAGILSVEGLIGRAVLVESRPNAKRDKKPGIVGYHRFYVPMRLEDRLYAIRIVAEEMDGKYKVNPKDMTLYDMAVDKEAPLSAVSSSAAVSGRDTARVEALSEKTIADGGHDVNVRLGDLLAGIQDTLGASYLRSASDETYYQIGAKRKGEMDAALRKRRPDLSEKQRAEAIAEIEKLGEEAKAGGSPKVEKAAAHWLLKGHIVLPEDNYKVLDALRISEQQGFDPMSYDDPNGILAQYTIKETAAERRVNPDAVPEFSGKRELPEGITVYTVRDDKAGQAAVRKVIDTHWGEDANPWCLAARNDDAWEMWEHYSGTEKRIAFKGGKLLAFSASSGKEKTWWDREDNPTPGIPATDKKDGDEVRYVTDDDTGEKRKTSERLRDGTKREWHENGQLERERLPDGTERRWYENGSLAGEAFPDGTEREWHESGQLKRERLPDGTERAWHRDGQRLFEGLPDGTRRQWNREGRMTIEVLPDGTRREWSDNGQPREEYLPNGAFRTWYENGQPEKETLPDGTKREWYTNGRLGLEALPDGTERRWDRNGLLMRETLPGGAERRFDRDGNPASEIYYQRGEGGDGIQLAENMARGTAAMEKVIAEQTDVMDAMRREDLGSISFLWGKPGRGSKFRGGAGVSHIIAHRNAQGHDGLAVARKMVEVIAKGELDKVDSVDKGSRAYLRHDGHTAVMSLYRDGERQTWLLTGWEDFKEKSPDEVGSVYDDLNPTLPKATRFHPEEGAGDFYNSKTSFPEKSKGQLAVNADIEAPRRANVRFDRSSGRAIVTLFRSADATSFVHELWHVALDDLIRFGGRENASEQAKADRLAALEWLGSADGRLTAEQHERWAAAGESYFATGKAPVSRLQGVFARMRRWMLDIYGMIKAIRGEEVPEHIRDVFDRILATPEETTAEIEGSVNIGAWANQNRLLKERLAELEERLADTNRRIAEIDETDETYHQSANTGEIIESIRNNEFLQISKGDIVEAYGEGVAAMLPEGVASERAFRTLDDVAARFGYENGGDFIADLIDETSDDAFLDAAERAAMQEELDAVAESGETSRSNAIGFIKSQGKLSYRKIAETFGDESARQLVKRCGPGLFAKDGLGLDEAAQLLSAAGAPVENDDALFAILMKEKKEPSELQKLQDDARRQGLREGLSKLKAAVAEARAAGREREKEAVREAREAFRARLDALRSEYEEKLRIKDAQIKGKSEAARIIEGKLAEVKRRIADLSRSETDGPEQAFDVTENMRALEERRAELETELAFVLKGDRADRKAEAASAKAVIDDERRAALERQAAGFEARLDRSRGRIDDLKIRLALEKKALRAELEAKRKKLLQKKDALIKKRRETAKIRKEIRAIVKRIARAAGDEKTAWRSREAISSLLSGYDLKNRKDEAIDARIEQMFRLMAESESTDDISMLSRTPLSLMTVTELRALDLAVRELQEEGRAAEAARREARKARIDGIYNDLYETLAPMTDDRGGAIAGSEDTGKSYRGAAGAVSKAKDWTFVSTLSAQRLFDWLDGGTGEYKGAFVRRFCDAVNEARDNELRNVFRRREAIERGLSELGLSISDMRRKIRVEGVERRDGQDFTVDQALSVYCGLKNEKSAKAILHGNLGYYGDNAQAAANALISQLTEAEKSAGDMIMADYDREFDRLNEAFIAAYNQGMIKEKNYTPMRRLEYTTGEGLLDAETGEALMNAKMAAGGLGGVESGFLVARRDINEEGQRAIDLGLFEIWLGQVDRQEHAAAFAGTLSELKSVIASNGRDVKLKTMVSRIYGKDAWRAVIDYYNVVARDDRAVAHDILDGVSSKLSRGMAVTYLCYNFGACLVQLASLPRILAYAGPTHVFSAIGEFAANPKAFLDRVDRLDPQMKDRRGPTMLRMLSEESKIINWGLVPIAFMDKMTAAVAWKAAYNANRSRGLSERDAVREAQRAVLLTQQITQAKDESRLWRTNRVMRLAMIFTSDIAQLWGMSAYDLSRAVLRGDVPAVFSMAMAITLPALMVKLMKDGPPDDDEEETWAGWIASAVARQQMEAVPGIGKELMALYDARLGDRRWSGSQYGAFVAPLDKLLYAATNMYDEFGDANERAVWSALEGLALVTGKFPVLAARRMWESGKAVMDDDPQFAVMNALGMKRWMKDRLRY